MTSRRRFLSVARGVEIIRELLPAARRIAVLWNAANPDARVEAEATIGAIHAIGLTAERLAVQPDAELREALASHGGRRVVSYAPNIPAMFRHSATYLHRILKGAKPSELTVELARSVEFVVNLRTAKALAIAIPQTFLVRADRVIE